MRKYLLLSMGFGLSMLAGVAHAGDIAAVQFRRDIADIGSMNANEYLFVGPGMALECDDDRTDVGDGTYVYYMDADNTRIRAMQCKIEWSGDYFQSVTINWCKTDNCSAANTIKMTETRGVCASGRVRTLNPVGLSTGSGCVICMPNYVRKGNDCVAKAGGAASGGAVVAKPGTTPVESYKCPPSLVDWARNRAAQQCPGDKAIKEFVDSLIEECNQKSPIASVVLQLEAEIRDMLAKCEAEKAKKPAPTPQPQPKPEPKPQPMPVAPKPTTPTLGQCGERYVSFDGNQRATDNEFLYSDLASFNAVNGKADGGNVSGLVYECDNQHCKDGTTVTMNRNHVFGGTVVTQQLVYKCIAPAVGDDRWELVSMAQPVITPKPEPVKQKNCKELRAGNSDGMACCDLPEEVAEWKNGECKCLGQNVTFVNDNGTGKCVSTLPPDPTFNCPDISALLAQWNVQCAGKQSILAQIADLELYCRGTDKNEAGYTAKYNTVWGLVNELCVEDNGGGTVIDLTIEIKAQRALAKQIQTLKSELDTLVSEIDVSVWRDAEGKFNTARLASDSIAAVVLGTTGGIVTSTVMKKKQAEKGFEDLQCTIGGQVVATWGDEFSVGIH